MVEQDILVLRQQLRELKQQFDTEKLLTNKREVENRPNIFPVGQVVDRQGKLPSDFLLLDGRSYERSSYPLLHSYLSGIVGYRTVTPINFTLPNTGQLVKSTSDYYTIVSGTTIDFAHGLGVIPDFIHYFLKCITAEIGYAVGDIIEVGNNFDRNIATITDGIGVASILTDTYVKIQYGVTNTLFHTIDRTTAGNFGPCTNANWKMMVKAFAIIPTKMIKAR